MLTFPRLLKTILFLCVAASYISVVHAQDRSVEAIAFLADNKAFITDWHDLPGGADPHIKTFKQVVPATQYTLGLAAFVPPSAEGERQFAFGIKLLAPDGQILINEPNYSIAKGNVPKRGGYILADPALTLDFSEKDVKGIYHFYIQMTDIQSGTQAYQDYAFTLK